jgi:hypothetical protein
MPVEENISALPQLSLECQPTRWGWRGLDWKAHVRGQIISLDSRACVSFSLLGGPRARERELVFVHKTQRWAHASLVSMRSRHENRSVTGRHWREKPFRFFLLPCEGWFCARDGGCIAEGVAPSWREKIDLEWWLRRLLPACCRHAKQFSAP